MYTADRSKNPTRLAELADRLRPVADDLVLHDEGGPGECLVRAGELLAHPAVADSVMDKLGSRADSAELALPGEAVRIRLRPQARDHSVELAAELTRPGDTVFVQPNHLHVGCPVMSGTPIEFGTGTVPTPAELPPAPPTELWEPPVTVALLDTGLDPHPWFADRPWLSEWGLSAETLHPDQPAARDRQAGHGTFVAGVLLQHAPGVTIRHHRTLASTGLTDDVVVAAGLDQVRRIARARNEKLDIVVITAGCHTADDTCPPLLRRALERTVDPIVVASAGNNASARPFWPAASPQVIAVAATGHRDQLAPFSNRGDWVNVAAPGVDIVSSFVRAVQHEHGIAPETVTREYGAAKWSGTSFAAPRVAASLARLLHAGIPPKAAREHVSNSFGG